MHSLRKDKNMEVKEIKEEEAARKAKQKKQEFVLKTIRIMIKIKMLRYKY